MLVNMLSSIISIVIVILVAIPVGAILTTLRALLTGRYLNRYFIVSNKSEGVYELHHQPAFGYYLTKKRKFYRLTKDAIQRFRVRFPNCTLITSTITQQSGNRNGTQVQMGSFTLIGCRLMTDFLILCNLAVYRKVSGKWLFAQLIRGVHKNVMISYQVVGKKRSESKSSEKFVFVV